MKYSIAAIGAVCVDSSWPEENPKATTFSSSSLNRVLLRMPFYGMGTSVSMFSKKVYGAIFLL